MKFEILKRVHDENINGRNAALVFLIENKGSTPGEDNSIMAVFEDGSSFGTIGGGAIEKDVIERCLANMKAGKSFEFDYNLSKTGELKMACGGNSRGYVKYFKASNRLVIFGAGHVSQKLARIAAKTNFEVIVIDDRQDFKDSKDFADIKEYICSDINEAINKIDFDKEKTFVVLCTRGHANDKEALKEIVTKDYKYLGMIGSKAKIRSVFNQLIEEGVDKELLSNVYTPIGLDIDNGSVEEIAISIMAEILMVKNQLDGKSQKISI